MRTRAKRHEPKGETKPKEKVERYPATAEWRLPSGQSLAEFALDSGLMTVAVTEPARGIPKR